MADNDQYSGFFGFWRGLVSDNGCPSSSRFAMLMLCVVVGVVIVRLFWKLTGMDSTLVQVWLPALPYIIGSLAGLIATPYAVNQGKNLVSDVLEKYAEKKSQQQ